MARKITTVTAALLVSLVASTANAQFTGPSIRGTAKSVAEAQTARPGSYLTLTGHITAHQRGDYFTFRDETGEIRVEIENTVWQNRPITPETQVRLLAEVDQGRTGRYLWVKSLEVIQK